MIDLGELDEWEERGEVEEAFWSRVDIRHGRECWPWLGALVNAGYGVVTTRIARSFGTRLAHRVACMIHRAAAIHVERREHVLHSCDVPACCNPRHLRWGTAYDNTEDKIAAYWSRAALARRLAGETAPHRSDVHLPGGRKPRVPVGEIIS